MGHWHYHNKCFSNILGRFTYVKPGTYVSTECAKVKGNLTMDGDMAEKLTTTRNIWDGKFDRCNCHVMVPWCSRSFGVCTSCLETCMLDYDPCECLQLYGNCLSRSYCGKRRGHCLALAKQYKCQNAVCWWGETPFCQNGAMGRAAGVLHLWVLALVAARAVL